MIESLTYAELGARLGVSPEAARKKAKAARLPSTLGNDGRRRVSVDLCELRHTRRPAGHRPERAGAAAGPDLRAGELDAPGGDRPDVRPGRDRGVAAGADPRS